MLGWIAGKIRWLFIILALGGPVMGYLTWENMQRIAAIKAQGVATDAALLGGTQRTGKRGSTSYDLNIAWKDSQAGDRTATVSVSNDYALSLLRDGKFTVPTIAIRYVPGNTELKPLVADDRSRQGDDDLGFLMACIGATIFGLLGFLAMWRLARRRAV